jgi:hypothetical protein
VKDLSLHLLDVCENSIKAGATQIKIMINEDEKKNELTLKIEDNGSGIDKEAVEKVIDPFYTTRKTRSVGLGIPMLAQAAREAGGNLFIKSKKGRGTVITANYIYNHIDRKPVGNIPETIISLLAMEGLDIDIIYTHTVNNRSFQFDSAEVRTKLQDINIKTPEVLSFLKEEIIKGISNIKSREEER